MNMTIQRVYRLGKLMATCKQCKFGNFSSSFKKNTVPRVNEKAQVSICQI